MCRGTTKILYHAVFRYMCRLGNTYDGESEERIFTQETNDPYISEIEIPDTSSTFTESYLQSFRLPIPEDQTKAALVDRLGTGWLAWGKKMEVCRMTGWDEYEVYYDEDCKAGIDQISSIVETEGFWKTVRS